MFGRNDDPMRTIGEVAETLDLPQHVLRFWETRFKEINPVKRAGGRRLYRKRDVEIVEAIRHLLYKEGYTIKGVQRILKEQGVDAVVADVNRSLRGEPEAAQTEPAEAPLPELANPPDEPRPAEPQIATTEPEPLAPSYPPPVPLPPPQMRTLDEADARMLRAILDEIEECQRLLKLTIR